MNKIIPLNKKKGAKEEGFKSKAEQSTSTLVRVDDV